MKLPNLLLNVTDAILEDTVVSHIESLAAREWAGSFDPADLRIVAEIANQCLWAGSFARLEVLLELCLGADVKPEVAMAAFAEEWSMCDAVGDLHFPTWILLCQVRDADVDFRRFISPSCRAWFEALDDRLIIYRGCSAGDEDGLSWSTRREVAERFARGHRVPVPNPVVVRAEVSKAAVLFATNGREEFEVLVDAVYLEDVISEPYDPQ